MARESRRPLGRQRGVTLVEVLVTVVVISAGLLGIAALQAASLRDSHAAVVRTQATALTDFILDRMRVNRPRALADEYNVDIGANKTGTDRASADVAAWKALLQANNADGSIERIGADGRIFVVTVAWGERETVGDAANPAAPGIAEVQFVTRTEI